MPEFLHENNEPVKTESYLDDDSWVDESPDWSIVSDLADKQNVLLENINRHNKVKNAEQQYTGIYNKENVREYLKDRYGENIELLEGFEDKHTLELYKTLMAEYPQLRIVKLINDTDEDDNASCTYNYPSGDPPQFHMSINYNFSNRETYIISKEKELKDYEHAESDDRLGRKYSIKRLSFKVGADWRECAKNKYLSPDEVLLHEFGHAYDFIENYMRDEYDSLIGDNRGPVVLHNALAKKVRNRSEFKLRDPTCSKWYGRKSRGYRKFEHRLNVMGINNYDEYLYARNQYYRDMPDEAYADNFAYEFILNHYDDYFTDSDDYSDGRVHIEKNKTMELDPDFVHILKIHQGLGVEIDRLDGDNVVGHISGFLATNFYSGKNVYLYENGDPKNPGEKWRICQGVSGIYFTPIHDPETGRIKQIITFTDQDGTYYHMSRSNQEADTVEVTPEELFQDLDVWFGDKVQMIYHQTEDVRERDDFHQPTIKDRIIYATNDDRNEITFTDQDEYDRCTLKRRWKTYYAYDGNNEYEILPLPRDEN